MLYEKHTREFCCPFLSNNKEHEGFCAGMDCMMWRFAEAKEEYTSDDLGYCGLAGRPVA